MKRQPKKLTTRSETIRTLSTLNLQLAVGGDGYTDGCYPTKTCPDPQ